MYLAAFHNFPELALSRNSLQCEALVCSMGSGPCCGFITHLWKQIHCSWAIFSSDGTAFLLLSARSVDFRCALRSGVNQRLEYGDGLACGVCLSTAIIVASTKVYTVWSSRVVVSISRRGSITIRTISQLFPSLFARALHVVVVLVSVLVGCSILSRFPYGRSRGFRDRYCI
jgi:hypothetical protein